jgi:MFS family permease
MAANGSAAGELSARTRLGSLTGLRPVACILGATFCHFASLYYLLPTLPLYVQNHGGSTYEVGLIVGAFALASLLTRPLVGRWMDRRGRRAFLVAGATIYVIASLGYLAIHSILGLLLWRVVHALGLATFSTAAASLAGDHAPPRRRGTVMGAFGLAQAAALTVGPTIGQALLASLGYVGLFVSAAGTALAAVVFALALPSDASPPPRAVAARLPRSHRALPDISAFPATVQFAASIAYGTIVSFIALAALERGLGLVGVFFALLAVSSMSVRLVAGRVYDAWGVAPILAPALVVLAGGLALLAMAASGAPFLLAAVLIGLGIGGTQTTLLAYVVDGSRSDDRSRNVATFLACWELGVAGGAILMGHVADAFGFHVMFMSAALLPLLGLWSLSWRRILRRRYARNAA